MVNVIIVGSKTYNNFTIVERELMRYFKKHGLHRADINIVHNGFKEALQFANKYGLKTTNFPENNQIELIDYVKQENSVLFAFWNGYSTDIKDIIHIAKQNDIRINIIES